MDNLTQDIINEKQNKILSFVNSDVYRPMKIQDIINFMQVPQADVDIFLQLINDLISNGKLMLTEKKKIMSLKGSNLVFGTYVTTSKGFGFVCVENDDNTKEDIFIKKSLAFGAMHKDKVLCKIVKNYGKKNPEGEIVKIVEKGYNFIIGTFQKSKGFGFVVPDEKRLFQDIFISKNNTLNARSNDKVVVKITKLSTDYKKPEGKIVEVLGNINNPEIDFISIIKQYELPNTFDENVEKELKLINNTIAKEELINRQDFRNIQTVTIDGEDAKDLDDAITICKLENGNFKLGVHIADVAHYVKENSSLDKEAIKRGTSVYLIDRVIPMLPSKLSNGVCSLNENCDRLTLSCVMEINQKGEVISYDIVEGVINVDKRCSYTIVNDVLTNENSVYKKEFDDFLPMFENMQILRNILLDKRIKRGAIEFDFSEPKVILHPKTKNVLDIKLYQRNVATSIIEEFMLVANETIAQHFFWLELPFLFRNHQEPDNEKIEKLETFIRKFGYNLKGSNLHSKAFQNVILKAKSTPEEMLINRIVLRSFKQARYSSKNEGHFGLATQFYCHFTSPIRRYPDLQIHRIIKEYLNGKLSQSRISVLDKKLPDIAKKTSLKERNAENAERELVQLKKVEFMQNKIGQTFDGIISGVTSWGIYVELFNTVEGMVSLKSIKDDYYIYDELNMCYIGENSRNTYTLGDKVKIKVTNVNISEKTIDFEFFDENF